MSIDNDFFTKRRSVMAKKMSSDPINKDDWVWWNKLVPGKLKQLHEDGYKVIIHCHQSEEIAQTLCRELNSKRNSSAQVVVADLGDNEAIKKLTQTIKSLDLLVNNASVFYPTSIKNSTIEDWDKTININLRAPFFISTD